MAHAAIAEQSGTTTASPFDLARRYSNDLDNQSAEFIKQVRDDQDAWVVGLPSFQAARTELAVKNGGMQPDDASVIAAMRERVEDTAVNLQYEGQKSVTPSDYAFIAAFVGLDTSEQPIVILNAYEAYVNAQVIIHFAQTDGTSLREAMSKFQALSSAERLADSLLNHAGLTAAHRVLDLERERIKSLPLFEAARRTQSLTTGVVPAIGTMCESLQREAAYAMEVLTNKQPDGDEALAYLCSFFDLGPDTDRSVVEQMYTAWAYEQAIARHAIEHNISLATAVTWHNAAIRNGHFAVMGAVPALY